MTCLEQLALCETKHELAAAAGDVAARLGFGYFALALWLRAEPQGRPVVWSIDNLPPDLRRARLDCFVALIDACGLDWMRHGVPHPWLVAAPRPELLRGQACAERFRELAQQHGVHGGLCVPVPGADGAAGSLTLATCRATGEPALNALQPLALLFSRHLHLACLPFVAADHAPRAPRLAPALRTAAYLG
jgi:hypothetical protein